MTHYRLLLKVGNEQARLFYMQETIDCNRSTRTLERQIGNLYYERMLMEPQYPNSQGRQAAEKEIRQEPKDIIKDPYVLEFLGLKDNTDFRENELEQAIIDKLQNFLQELGKGFAFVGRQYRLTTDTGKHFYADLVFYNYILKFFLIIDLKAEPLTHQDIGQMDMYVRYFEDKMRQRNLIIRQSGLSCVPKKTRPL
ncbi:MAG: PDDEXK nuclease domain-containing protein [Alistipes shahii]